MPLWRYWAALRRRLANDGLGYLFILLPLLVLTRRLGVIKEADADA
jgi:hypothetical protein